MAVKFTELLDANRLRPLWRIGQSADAAGATAQTAESARAAGPARPSHPLIPVPGTEGDFSERLEDLDPESAPLEPPTPETPLAILGKVERMLQVLLGPEAILLNIYIHPLRRALALLSGAQVPPHPLQQALRTNNLPMLIYAFEDSLRALLTAQRGSNR